MRKADAIDLQLSLHAPQTVTFDEGGATLLTPGQFVPVTTTPPVSLNGDWEVVYWPFARPESELLAPVAADTTWELKAQPGILMYYDPEQSADSIPNWNRMDLRHLDPDDGAIARTTVTIPADWTEKRVLLRFEGIYPAGKIYWDGELVGEQFSGLTPIEIDVTDRAAPGTRHSVAVRFYRRHPSVQLDMPRHAIDFVGLSRQAYLHAVESVFIADTRLQPELADDFASGAILGEVCCRNTRDTDVIGLLFLEMTDAEGTMVAAEGLHLEIPAGGCADLDLNFDAEQVTPWNAEVPTLYTLTLRLIIAGQPVQEVVQRVGFRRFEFPNQRPVLNGNPVKFRGVNHLTFHPEYGMYTPEPWLRQCLTMMKKANVNAIRTHFYGPPELAALCDELGLYLLQELPIDWGHPYVHDPVHLGPILHRMEAGVRRDRNHASVMVWSIGNENMARNEEEYEVFMTHLRLAEQMVKRMDPTRPTMFPPPGPANKIKGIFEARIGDIGDTHYSFNLAKEFAKTGVLTNPRTWGFMPDGSHADPTFETHTREELLARGWSGVWFSSEYGINNMQADLLNAPYTSVIADVHEDALSGKNSQQVFIDRLNREWGYMRDDPTCLGGAYFPWMASGAGDPWGWTRWGEDADWGVITGDLTPKATFWAMRVIFSPVRFPARITWTPGDTVFRITVHNDYNGIDLSACTLRTQMAGGPPWMGQMSAFRDVPMQAAPGTTTTVDVPIWNPGTLKALESGKPVVCRCIVLDPTGFRPILADVIVMPQAEQVASAESMPVGPDAVLE